MDENVSPSDVYIDYAKHGSCWFKCKHKVLLPWRRATAQDKNLDNIEVPGFGPGSYKLNNPSDRESVQCKLLQLCRDCGGIARIAYRHNIDRRSVSPNSIHPSDGPRAKQTSEAWKCTFELVCRDCGTTTKREIAHVFSAPTREYVEDYPDDDPVEGGGSSEGTVYSGRRAASAQTCTVCGSIWRELVR